MPGPSGRSGRQGSVRFSSDAEKDLEGIGAYASENFGAVQEQKYRDSLLRVLELLAVFPKLGSEQEHIAVGLRRHVHAAHAIYYSKHKDGLLVERILGSGQDPLFQFSDKK